MSVISQADTEHADLARETMELSTDAAAEHAELTNIYVHRGLEPRLARQIAEQQGHTRSACATNSAIDYL